VFALFLSLCLFTHDAEVHKSLTWLKENLESEAWALEEESLGNRRAKQLVVEAATAYVLLLHPDLEGCEALRKDLDRKVTAVAGSRVATVSFGLFANWVEGFAALYVLEKAQRGLKDERVLNALASGMEDRQNAEGGWGHGTGLGVGFYPSTLVATSYWALFTLGGCRRFGVELDEFVIEEALDLLDRVQAESGGFPYGGPGYLKGVEAGRTCGVVLALAALGKTGDPRFRKAAAYLRRNLDAIPQGHASPAMHVLAGAMGAHVVNEQTWNDYRDTVLERVAKLQEEDGSFKDIVPGSPDSFGFMGGEQVNTAYRTALYAAALATPRARFVASLRAGHPPALPVEKKETVPAAKRRWAVPSPEVEALAFGNHCWLTLMANGSVNRISPGDGKTLGGTAITLKDSMADLNRLAVTGDYFLAWSEPPEDAQYPQSLKALLQMRDEPSMGSLICFSMDSGGVAWASEFQGRLEGWSADANSLYLLDRSGSLRRRSLSLGTTIGEYPRRKVRVNVALAALPGGVVAVSSESRVTAFNASGEVIWKSKVRGGRGVTPPAVTVLREKDGKLYMGATDGSVSCLDAETGRPEWKVKLGSAVRGLLVPDGGPVALTWDRRVHGLMEAWIFDAGQGKESTHPPVMRLDGSLIWISEPARESLFALDVDTGIPVARLPISPGVPWTAMEGKVLVAEGKQLVSYDVR
jgi:outer membrane protein assembly factor BamB